MLCRYELDELVVWELAGEFGVNHAASIFAGSLLYAARNEKKSSGVMNFAMMKFSPSGDEFFPVYLMTFSLSPDEIFLKSDDFFPR